MPWHDNSLTFVGPSVVDLAQHFIERSVVTIDEVS
jgi:phosphatidylserine/phosphatidylglycerophosphate/cardiolipin synthase-like enzyme